MSGPRYTPEELWDFAGELAALDVERYAQLKTEITELADFCALYTDKWAWFQSLAAKWDAEGKTDEAHLIRQILDAPLRVPDELFTRVGETFPRSITEANPDEIPR